MKVLDQTERSERANVLSPLECCHAATLRAPPIGLEFRMELLLRIAIRGLPAPNGGTDEERTPGEPRPTHPANLDEGPGEDVRVDQEAGPLACGTIRSRVYYSPCNGLIRQYLQTPRGIFHRFRKPGLSTDLISSCLVRLAPSRPSVGY